MSYDYAKKLPKSLWKFYFKYAMRGHWPLMIGYAVLFMCVMSDAVLFPNYQRWFIALFEQTPPAGVGFVEFALPTILFITGLFILWDTCLILRGMLHGRWQPIISNQISDVLQNGQIIEQGTHNQLLRRRGEYARLWKMQSGGFLQE